MGHDDRREIFERLEALERLMRSRHEERGAWGDERHRERCHHDHGRDRGDGDFEEKRIIDTIVRLVSERVERIVADQRERSPQHDDGGGEKRIVDLIVGLVSEHVQEIVTTELDRRFGPADPGRAGEGRPPSQPARPSRRPPETA